MKPDTFVIALYRNGTIVATFRRIGFGIEAQLAEWKRSMDGARLFYNGELHPWDRFSVAISNITQGQG